MVAYLHIFLGKEQRHSGRSWILLQFCHLNSCPFLHKIKLKKKNFKKTPKKISSWSSRTLLFHIQIQFIASTSIKLSFHFSGYLTFGFYLAINFFLFFYFFFISFLIDRPFCLLLFFRSLSTAHFIAKIVVRFKSQFPCNKHETSKVIPNACKADCIIVSTSV